MCLDLSEFRPTHQDARYCIRSGNIRSYMVATNIIKTKCGLFKNIYSRPTMINIDNFSTSGKPSNIHCILISRIDPKTNM